MSKDAQAVPTTDLVISTIAPLPIPSRARVAKSVDARDLKSLGRNWPCRFESGSGHQLDSFRESQESYFVPQNPCNSSVSCSAGSLAI
jgi:hypothetical protein